MSLYFYDTFHGAGILFQKYESSVGGNEDHAEENRGLAVWKR